MNQTSLFVEEQTNLGAMLRATKKITKASLGDLTVLSPQNDPFRLDTKASHVKGRWFRDRMEECGLMAGERQIHNRGIHYAIVSLGSARLPNGSPYINDADCWAFLEDASSTARWLGYVPWERIFDARNADPIVRAVDREKLRYSVRPADDPSWIGLDSIWPEMKLTGSQTQQQYRLVFYGEKTSLGSVLDPLAEKYGADLYLPSGEISNSQLARMAADGADDGREMIVFIFADCDPAGYQMAVSIGHKLRALRESLHSNTLSFRVQVPALTVGQVRDLGLPSTPLKETELRAAGWRERYGVEQTEIDALATLRSDVLEDIVGNAVDPFFDHGLAERNQVEKERWEAEARQAIENSIGPERIAEMQENLKASLELLQSEAKAIENEIEGATIRIPDYQAPHVEIPAIQPAPLVSSDMPLQEAIRILRERKDYTIN